MANLENVRFLGHSICYAQGIKRRFDTMNETKENKKTSEDVANCGYDLEKARQDRWNRIRQEYIKWIEGGDLPKSRKDIDDWAMSPPKTLKQLHLQYFNAFCSFSCLF